MANLKFLNIGLTGLAVIAGVTAVSFDKAATRTDASAKQVQRTADATVSDAKQFKHLHLDDLSTASSAVAENARHDGNSVLEQEKILSKQYLTGPSPERPNSASKAAMERLNTHYLDFDNQKDALEKEGGMYGKALPAWYSQKAGEKLTMHVGTVVQKERVPVRFDVTGKDGKLVRSITAVYEPGEAGTQADKPFHAFTRYDVQESDGEN